jgi:integrase/recombinase XerD
MTPLRAKYIRDLVIHGRSKNTQEAYTRYVCDLARYYRRSPELISYEEVTGWLYYLITERHIECSNPELLILNQPRSRPIELEKQNWPSGTEIFSRFH